MNYKINHFLTKSTLVALVSFASVLTFAIQVGQEIELTKYVNGRAPNADFRRSTNNVVGVLATGTNGRVMEVRRFRSGNSGVLLNITEGPMQGRRLWVYYVPSDPSLRLFTPTGTPTPVPAPDGSGTTLRPVPGQPDPTTDRPPVVAPPPAPVPPPPVVAPPAPVPPPPVVAPPPLPRPPAPIPAPTIPGMIDDLNGANMNPGGPTGCRDCAPAGTAAPAPVPTAPPPAPAVAAGELPAEFANLLTNTNANVIDRSSNAARQKAHRYVSLRAALTSYALHCDHVFFPDANVRRNSQDRLGSRFQSYMNSTIAAYVARVKAGIGGEAAMDSFATGYNNRAANIFSRNSGALGLACNTLRPQFEAVLRMSASEFEQFVDMNQAQREQFLRTRTR